MREHSHALSRDLADPALWARSDRASRSRRARAARQSQLSVRSKTTGIATLTALVLGTTSAFAASGGASADGGSATSTPAATPSATTAPAKGGSAQTRAIQKALGLPQTGRMSTKLRKAIRTFQRAHGLDVDGVAGPKTLAALGVTSAAAAAPATTAPATSGVTAKLAAIAQCESGGNPAAVSQDGLYYGKYQFDVSTWKANGGTEDNAAVAPEAEQDSIATRLYQSQGSTPWPVCGK